MRRMFLRMGVAGAGLIAGAALAATAPPADLQAARAKLAKAAAAGDVAQAMGLTQFPLESHVFGGPARVSRSAFPSYFKANGFQPLSTCVGSQPMTRDAKSKSQTWTVDCDGSLFRFSKVGEDWRLTGFENVNE